MTTTERIQVKIIDLQHDLGELELRKEGIEQSIAMLQDLLEEAGNEGDEGNDRPPARTPRAKPAGAGENGDRKPGGKAIPRIRDLLAAEGPLRGTEISQKLNMSATTVSGAMKKRPDWFEKVDPSSLFSAWCLTAAGKAAASETE